MRPNPIKLFGMATIGPPVVDASQMTLHAVQGGIMGPCHIHRISYPFHPTGSACVLIFFALTILTGCSSEPSFVKPYDEGKYSEAIPNIEAAAQQGDAFAERAYGPAYLNGN